MPDILQEYVFPHERGKGRTIVRIVPADISPEERAAATREMKLIAGRILARHYQELAEQEEVKRLYGT